MIELWIHKTPMKNILYAVAKCYSLDNAIKAVNKDFDLDITEENVIKWGHISEEDAIKKQKDERRNNN